jgi:hypothetical protein
MNFFISIYVFVLHKHSSNSNRPCAYCGQVGKIKDLRDIHSVDKLCTNTDDLVPLCTERGPQMLPWLNWD